MIEVFQYSSTFIKFSKDKGIIWNASLGKAYWVGKEYDRRGPEYQELLDRAYQARFDANEDYRNALGATKDYNLTYSIDWGRTPENSIITEEESLTRLYKLRAGNRLC